MSGQTGDFNKVYLSGILKEDLALFKKIFQKDAVMRVKRIEITAQKRVSLAVIYFDGMVDSDQLNEAVIKPLVSAKIPWGQPSVAEYIETGVLFAKDVKKQTSVAEILRGILYGEAVILIDGSKTALTTDVKGWRTRGISEPEDERVLQGPREGFDEAAMLNLSMIRRKLQTPDLCIEMQRFGRRTDTMVFICYLGSLVDKSVLSELKKRLSKIDIDGVLDSNYLSEQIRDNKYSFFKTLGTTERPDVVAARLLEGRIALVVDGTPVVVTLPYLFSENFQSDEDYYLNFMVASAGRLLRFICFFIAISVPAVFVALTTYHKALLPTSLAITVAELRAGVPFSPFGECIILIFIFEILKETGIRMPQSLGHALSIVGGLVVGQAAVESGIISTPMLIVIALGGISGLMVPRLKAAVFYLRIIFTLASALFGLLGFTVCFCITVMHIISIHSFGVDYTVSLRNSSFQSLKDTFWRVPWKFMRRRPDFNKNTVRQGEKQ